MPLWRDSVDSLSEASQHGGPNRFSVWYSTAIMKIALRVLAAIINGVRFVLDPAGVTARLGMDLQTGASASTQLGDIGGLFLGG